MKVFCILLGLGSWFYFGIAGYTGPINEAGLNLIKSFERFAPDFYTDPVGIKTVGYGHACHAWDCSIPLEGLYTPPLTIEQGNELLASDLQQYEECVKKLVTWSDLNANQFSALTSLAYNFGCRNLRSSKLFLELLNQGDTYEASKQFGRWVFGGRPSVKLPGLIRRREAERVLFCSSGGCEIESCRGKLQNIQFVISHPARKEPNSSSEIVGQVYTYNKFMIYSMKIGENVNGNSEWYLVRTYSSTLSYQILQIILDMFQLIM